MIDLGNIGTVSNGETWTEYIYFDDEETGDAFDFSGITAVVMQVTEMDGSLQLSGTYADTTITLPGDGVLGWVFSVDQMRSLAPGEYKFGVVATFTNETLQMCVGRKTVVDRIID
jgi:hypothetical protein